MNIGIDFGKRRVQVRVNDCQGTYSMNFRYPTTALELFRCGFSDDLCQDCGFSDETLIKAKLAKPMKTNRISNIYIVDS